MPAPAPESRCAFAAPEASGFALMELIAVMALASAFLAGAATVRHSLVRQTVSALQTQQAASELRSAAERFDLCALSRSSCPIEEPDRWQWMQSASGCLLQDKRNGLSLPAAGCTPQAL